MSKIVKNYFMQTFDSSDISLFSCSDNLLLKAKAIKYNLLPRLSLVLAEAITKVPEIYGIEILADHNIQTLSPNFREKRESDLQVDYTWCMAAIGPERKPVWGGVKRIDGTQATILHYKMGFELSEEGLEVFLSSDGKANLDDESSSYFFDLLDKYKELIPLIIDFSKTQLIYGIEDEQPCIESFSKLLGRIKKGKDSISF